MSFNNEYTWSLNRLIYIGQLLCFLFFIFEAIHHHIKHLTLHRSQSVCSLTLLWSLKSISSNSLLEDMVLYRVLYIFFLGKLVLNTELISTWATAWVGWSLRHAEPRSLCVLPLPLYIVTSFFIMIIAKHVKNAFQHVT